MSSINLKIKFNANNFKKFLDLDKLVIFTKSQILSPAFTEKVVQKIRLDNKFIN